MLAHRMKTTVQSDGKILLEGLPFAPGERIELIILADRTSERQEGDFPMRGKGPYRFDDPFSPASPPEDWEASA